MVGISADVFGVVADLLRSVVSDMLEVVASDMFEVVASDMLEGVDEDPSEDDVVVPTLPCRKQQQFKYKPENTFNYNGTAPKPLPTPFLPCITVQRLLQTNQPLNLPDLCCSTKHTT